MRIAELICANQRNELAASDDSHQGRETLSLAA
jgi:hypothetical protein